MTNFLHNLVHRGAGMTAAIAAPPASPFAAADPESAGGKVGAEDGFALEETAEVIAPLSRTASSPAFPTVQNISPPRDIAVGPAPLMRETAGHGEAATRITSPARPATPERFLEGTTSVDAANASFAVDSSPAPLPSAEEASRPLDGKTEASAPAEESEERTVTEPLRFPTLTAPVVAAENRTFPDAPTPIPPRENAAVSSEARLEAGALTPVLPRQAGGDFWERGGAVSSAMREATSDKPTTPRVEVRIGKIEVKMTRPPEPPTRPAAPSGRRGFDDYARVRRGLGRSGR